MFSSRDHDDKVRWVRGWVERDPLGSKLTPEAQQRAAEFGAEVFHGPMGIGEAARIGVKHVTKDVLK